jgi:hypothetical protein
LESVILNNAIEKAIERHGGIDVYNRIGGILLRMERLSGMIPFMLGIGRTFPMPTTINVEPHAHRTTFHGAGTGGSDVVYQRGTVTIDGTRIENYRHKFNGLRKIRIFSKADAAYFFGYALSDYFSYPFSLPNYRVIESRSLRNGEQRLVVEFPAGSDTHSRVQAFHFDSTGLLFRHDYRADILGPMFCGTQHYQDYRFDLAIPVSQGRYVTFRIGSWASPLVVLRAKFKVESIED